MDDHISLRDEYDVLIDELRQNRQIQLQSFLATPIWLAVFFGLLGSGGARSGQQPELILIPIPLVFINLLLLLDRRRSSDIIIAYLRTAVDQQLSDRPGWNHLLPVFRQKMASLPRANMRKAAIPQRFDFNVIVWASYLAVSLICCGLFISVAPERLVSGGASASLVVLAYLAMLYRLFRQSAVKGNLLKAWTETLKERKKQASAA